MVSFESFIDIYENDECNDEIERIIDDLGMADLEENVNNIIGNDKPSNSAGIVKVDKSIKDETIEEETKENIIKEQLEDTVNVLNDLYVMMPSNTGAAEAVEAIEEEIIEDLELLSGVDETKNYVGMNSVKRISYNKNSKFSISKGVSYATKHATSPNVKKYSACVRGDCTNFTSQIKHEGGVPKYLKYGQKGAWNYKVVSATAYPKLNYTPRWCGADKFCKFYGIKSKWKTGAYSNKRTAFIKFAAAVKKGSFIAFDETNDGSWNHCGFVTAANSSATISYHGSKYKNFKVAQHTTNYYRWVSDSKCNWETKPYDGCPKVVYAIIN